MSRRDIERELEALGRRVTPPPSDAFEDELAQRLHAVAATLPASASTVRAPKPWTWVQPALATAAVLALLAGALLTQAPDEPSGPIADGVARDGQPAPRPPDGQPDDPPPPPAATEPQRTPRPTPDTTPAPTRDPMPERTSPPEPERSPEPGESLQLGCQGTERGGQPVISCRWSAARHPDFAGYRLWRSDGRERLVVHRTQDRDATTYSDTGVESGVAYTYVIEAFDAAGTTIGSGGPVRARTSQPEPETEPRPRT